MLQNVQPSVFQLINCHTIEGNVLQDVTLLPVDNLGSSHFRNKSSFAVCVSVCVCVCAHLLLAQSRRAHFRLQLQFVCAHMHLCTHAYSRDSLGWSIIFVSTARHRFVEASKCRGFVASRWGVSPRTTLEAPHCGERA